MSVQGGGGDWGYSRPGQCLGEGAAPSERSKSWVRH